MKKQLFYKDIFDKFGNKIPVLNEHGLVVSVERPNLSEVVTPIFPLVSASSHAYEDFVFLSSNIVDFDIWNPKILYLDEYDIVQFESTLYNSLVNVKINDGNFIQTGSTEEGIIWIQIENDEEVDTITVEFNGIVKSLNYVDK